jgi:hypothetical protein
MDTTMKVDDEVESTSPAPPPLPAAGARKGAGEMSDDDDASPWAQVAPRYQEEEDDARRVLSDKRSDADVMREYLTDQVTNNPEFERAVAAAFKTEEDKAALARNRPASTRDVVGEAAAAVADLAPPSAGKRGKKVGRDDEGAQTSAPNARSPLRRVPGISPKKKKALVAAESSDDEGLLR